MTIIKCINFGHIILAPPTMLVKIRHCFATLDRSDGLFGRETHMIWNTYDCVFV